MQLSSPPSLSAGLGSAAEGGRSSPSIPLYLSAAVQRALSEQMGASVQARWCAASLQAELDEGTLGQLRAHLVRQQEADSSNNNNDSNQSVPPALLTACRDACWVRLLHSSFLHPCLGGRRLPANITSQNRTTLAGLHVLQLVECVDVAHSNAELADRSSSNSNASGGRLWKMVLTDGDGSYFAMERHTCAELTQQAMKPGVKLALRDVSVRYGMLMLEQGNVMLLGGSAPDLEDGKGAQAAVHNQIQADGEEQKQPQRAAAGYGAVSAAPAAVASAASSAFIAALSLPVAPVPQQPSIWQRPAQPLARPMQPQPPPISGFPSRSPGSAISAPLASTHLSDGSDEYDGNGVDDGIMHHDDEDAEALEALMQAEAEEAAQQTVAGGAVVQHLPEPMATTMAQTSAAPRPLLTAANLLSPEPEEEEEMDLTVVPPLPPLTAASVNAVPAAASAAQVTPVPAAAAAVAASSSPMSSSSSSQKDLFPLSQSMPGLEPAPSILVLISPQINNVKSPATAAPVATSVAAQQSATHMAMEDVPPQAQQQSQPQPSSQPIKAEMPLMDTAPSTFLTPPTHSPMITAATPHSVHSVPLLTPMSAVVLPALTPPSSTAQTQSVANSSPTSGRNGNTAATANSPSVSSPAITGGRARQRSSPVPKIEPGAGGAAAQGGAKEEQQSSRDSSPGSSVVLVSSSLSTTQRSSGPSVKAEPAARGSARTASGGATSADDFLDSDDGMETAEAPAAAQTPKRAPKPASQQEDSEIAPQRLARALEVCREGRSSLFPPSDPLQERFRALPHVYLRDLYPLAERINRPLHVLVRVRVVGVVEAVLSKLSSFVLRVRLLDAFDPCDVRFARPFLEHVLGCSAEQCVARSEKEREPLYDLLQPFIDVNDHIMQLKVMPKSVKAGGREWVSSALEPQIVHLRPPVDEDKRVLQPPRNEEAKQ